MKAKTKTIFWIFFKHSGGNVQRIHKYQIVNIHIEVITLWLMKCTGWQAQESRGINSKTCNNRRLKTHGMWYLHNNITRIKNVTWYYTVAYITRDRKVSLRITWSFTRCLWLSLYILFPRVIITLLRRVRATVFFHSTTELWSVNSVNNSSRGCRPV